MTPSDSPHSRDHDAMPADEAAPVTSRRERRRQEISERILAAAEALFVEHGYEETKVTDICERADVAYGTFFNHYPAKQDLLVAMGDRGVTEISRKLHSLSERSLPIEKALLTLFQDAAAELEGVEPGRRALTARVQAATFTDPPLERDRSLHAAFERFIRSGMAGGTIRDDASADALSDLLSSAYMTMFLRWVHIDDFPVRKRAKALAQLVSNSLAPVRA